ncbi:MAG TPA: hypothetical protein VF718_07020 [Allosphingosinicella sp.]|jgi:hypothetical protein
MTAKTSERKRNAFLEAFARTGNQTLAVERAGLSRSTIRNLRRSDAGFDSRFRSAAAQAAERLAAFKCNRPPEGWKRSGGAELAVQRAGRRVSRVVRRPGASWTPRAEERFLGKLRQCGNARLACREAGMTLSSYEAHWRRWPDFRRRVEAARAFARLRIKAMVEAQREAPWEPDWDAIDALPRPGIAEAIRIVRRARRR